MSYSPDAVRFRSIPLSDQVRVSDRVSFAYLEYSEIIQDRTGVWAVTAGEPKRAIQIPAAGLASLLLGPGTSVTAAAMSTLAASGCAVIFTGGGGHPVLAAARPLTSTSKWAMAQARMVATPSSRLAAAKTMYLARFSGGADISAPDIRTLRGYEGRLIRDLYRDMGRKHNVTGFRRDTKSQDPVNVGLNLGNSILYGVAATVCQALGVNPALGVIHNGDIRAFLYDVADVFKPVITIPIAFATPDGPFHSQQIRTRVREAIIARRMLDKMVRLVTDTLSPHVSADDNIDSLIDEEHGIVLAHVNYSDEA